MSNWAYIENNEVKELHYNLPQNWGNISNFFAMENDLQALRSYGWIPVIDESEVYEPSKVWVNETTYIIDYDRNVVVMKTSVTPRSDPNENLSREMFITMLRNVRNNKLTESDWTQLVDIQQLRNEEWKTAWFNYRQILRDLPEVYTNYPYESVVSIEEVVWPEQPNN